MIAWKKFYNYYGQTVIGKILSLYGIKRGQFFRYPSGRTYVVQVHNDRTGFPSGITEATSERVAKEYLLNHLT